MAELDGKAALITGAASGIGRATAHRLAKEGARVTVADVDEEGGTACAEEIGGQFVRTDVSDPTQIEVAVRATVDAFGRLDIAHLNAGVGVRNAEIATLDLPTYTREIGINIGGVVFGTKAAVNAMSDGGSIIATASLAGLGPYPSDPLYGLTKHAVVGFVRSAAVQLAPKGIWLNAICPGFVETPLLEDMVTAFKASGFPLLQPEDVADAVLQIATSEASGQVFVCQPGLICEPYKFRGIPGPRVEGAEGQLPPIPG